MAERIHFVGIGGAGMAPLASMALECGACVSGSDRELNDKSAALTAKGARVFAGHAAEHLPENTELLVYSSAVGPDNPERLRAGELGIRQIRRGAFLAEFSLRFKRVVAVSGSHGKSSISAMLTWVMERNGFEPGFLIGAKRPGAPSGSIGGKGDLFLIEADESDGTHTLLYPELGVIPNFDADHEWSVGGAEALRENFRTFARNCKAVIASDTPDLRELFADMNHVEYIALPGAEDCCCSFYGFFAKNAALALAAAERLGCSRAAAGAVLPDYPGIERRMCLHLNRADLTVMEDYAHHPTEVAHSIALLRKRFPGRHLRVVFQPHRYARLERFFADFVRALSAADSVIVTDVFAAWSESGRFSGADLAAALPNAAPAAPGGWEAVARQALELPRPAVIAVLGAGDIDRLLPLLGADQPSMRQTTAQSVPATSRLGEIDSGR